MAACCVFASGPNVPPSLLPCHPSPPTQASFMRKQLMQLQEEAMKAQEAQQRAEAAELAKLDLEKEMVSSSCTRRHGEGHWDVKRAAGVCGSERLDACTDGKEKGRAVLLCLPEGCCLTRSCLSHFCCHP